MQTEQPPSPPKTYKYRNLEIEILIGGYRYGKITVTNKEDIESLVDAVILAHEQHKRKTDY